ncbi:MOV10 family protein [Megaselia abdita]
MSTSADFTFNFLLYLYKNNYFTGTNGKIKRNILNKKFDEFCEQNQSISEHNQKLEIITLLKEHDYILFNNRKDYIILKLKEFHRDLYNYLEEIDKNHIQEQLENLRLNVTIKDDASENLTLNNDKPEQTVDSGTSSNGEEEEEENDDCTLELFDRLNRSKDFFKPTSFGCFVCRKNFVDQNKYDEHIIFHKEFKNRKRHPYGLLELSYTLGLDSNKLRFKITSFESNIVIERVILVLQSFNYVNLDELPYHLEEDDDYIFEVDRNGFTLNVVHPIIVLYSKPDSSYENIEEHHFIRKEEYPPSKIQLRSIKVPDREELTVIKHANYKVSSKLKKCLCLDDPEKLMEYLSIEYYSFEKYLKTKTITPSNFYDVYKTLVEIEDIEGEREYEQLNQESAAVTGDNGEFSVYLNISHQTNLAELIAPFDNIFLFDNTLENDYEFRGSVHKVLKNEVLFTVSCGMSSIRMMSGPSFKVRFVPNRYQVLCQYSALKKTDVHLLRYLFPKIDDIRKKPFKRNLLKLYNKAIEGNPEQLQAVEQIVCDGWTNVCPYVLFGPPGTGKTTTIVECIIQLLNKDKTNRILVTAQSNSACDEITMRLKNILYSGCDQKPIVLRIYSQTYRGSIERVDDDFYEISNVCHSTHFYPTVEVLKEYRVIISTPFLVGMYHNSGLKKGVFSHIFFDENASVSIPEALCSISGVWSQDTRIVLSGDPKQLGHIFKYKANQKFGFDLSLMERLLELPVYRVDEYGNYNVGVQTRLRKNFRCHPEILRVFNNLCYNGELEAHGDGVKVNRAIGWHGLSNPKVPIVFHPVREHCQRSLYETSWWNPAEIEIVQYSIIKTEMEKRNWGNIEVGSAEIFQGREKQVIIVSTVRSQTPTVGFLNNIKKLNVIISRAEALLIVIGNPDTLVQDDNWCNFLHMMYISNVFRNNIC